MNDKKFNNKNFHVLNSSIQVYKYTSNDVY